ncbi:MAG: hypothetical protein R3C97_11675, partial [Geminicoccaceae bacterium]
GTLAVREPSCHSCAFSVDILLNRSFAGFDPATDFTDPALDEGELHGKRAMTCRQGAGIGKERLRDETGCLERLNGTASVARFLSRGGELDHGAGNPGPGCLEGTLSFAKRNGALGDLLIGEGRHVECAQAEIQIGPAVEGAQPRRLDIAEVGPFDRQHVVEIERAFLRESGTLGIIEKKSDFAEKIKQTGQFRGQIQVAGFPLALDGPTEQGGLMACVAPIDQAALHLPLEWIRIAVHANDETGPHEAGYAIPGWPGCRLDSGREIFRGRFRERDMNHVATGRHEVGGSRFRR